MNGSLARIASWPTRMSTPDDDSPDELRDLEKALTRHAPGGFVTIPKQHLQFLVGPDTELSGVIGRKRFIVVSQGFCSALGYSLPALLATPWRDLVHPEDMERTERAAADMEDRAIANFANRYLRADGSWQPLRWYCPAWTGSLTCFRCEIPRED